MMVGYAKPFVFLVSAVLVLGVLGGCASQRGNSGGNQALARENRDLRSMMKQAMRELRQVEAEQERLRATVETLEYRQRVLAERAGVDAGALAAGPSAPADYSVARAQVQVPQYGSAAPDGGLDALSAGISVGPPRLFGQAPQDAPVVSSPGTRLAQPQQFEDQRVRGRVVGPVPIEAPVAAGNGGADAGEPEVPLRTVRSRSSRSSNEPRPSAPMQIRAEDEPRVPVVPPALTAGPYGEAAKHIRNGEYDAAVQSFRDFIYANPQSPYADDAQYWIGESYLRKGAYSKAIIEFNQVVVKYRSGDRSAKSLLKQAEIFSLLGDEVDARLSLQKVVSHYPGTAEAARAAGLLAGVGGEAAAGR